MASRYSTTNEARAHTANTTSQALRGMPHAELPEVSAIAAGMNATRETPRTAPTTQDSTVV